MLAKEDIDYKAAAGVPSRSTQVPQEVIIRTASVAEGIGQDRQLLKGHR